MGVNQSQIDKILSGASAEDPDVRLDNLEKELDFIKASIKRLLIDIRERMNELDNPFTRAAATSFQGAEAPIPVSGDAEGTPEEEAEEEAAASRGEEAKAEPASPSQEEETPEIPAMPGDQVVATIPPKITARSEPAGSLQQQEKLKLHKVHRLFEWTSRSCRTYGHDRLEMMVESYRAMGYISAAAADQIREIARLVPASPGDSHEIGPDEFVSELYVLNRILDPGDTSLDRDMIEVLMMQRHRCGELPGGAKSPEDIDTGDKWIDLMDRI